LLSARSQTVIHILGQVRRNQSPKLLDVATVNAPGKAERSVHNPSAEAKEVLRYRARSRIAGVKGGHKHCAIAPAIELPVNASLREDGGLELAERAGDFLVLPGVNESVLEDAAKPDAVALHDEEELRSARMHVGRIDAAGLEKAHRHADVEASREGERLSGLAPARSRQQSWGMQKSDAALTIDLVAPPAAPLAG
jgi:hypothetical protein